MVEKTNRIRILKEKIKEELSKYHRTKELVYLVQASEKAWMMYITYIQNLSGEDTYGYPDVKRISFRLIKEKKISKELFEKAFGLHQFHYGAWVEDADEVGKYIHFCLKKIK